MRKERLIRPGLGLGRGLAGSLAAGAFALAALAAGCAGIEDRDATSFAYIHSAIIGPNCATSNCHSALASTAGLEFNTKESAYAYFTGQTCAAPDIEGEATGNFVVPFQPESSKLMYLIRGIEVPNPMPPDTPLPEAEIELIEQWILQGAECE